MAKYNTKGTKARVTSPVTTEAQPSGTTHEGAPGYKPDDKAALFLLAVTNMVGEDTFYESASDRDARYRELVHRVAVNDPEWMASFLPWLRRTANMRSAPLVGALEATAAMIETEMPGGRQLVDSVIARADEPGEALAYWMSTHGRAIPKPVKRGVGDAIIRLGNEFNYVKWGTSEARGFNFADILNLTHPGDRKGSAQHIRSPWQHDLFGYAVHKPYDDDAPIPETLELLTRRQTIMTMPLEDRRQVLENPDMLQAAGITWEQLAGWLQGPMDAQAWEAIIPSMGYMALIRNLRNFDEAGISDALADQVAARLSDPEQVARSRQLPFRFLSAHLNAPSVRWTWPLERALGAAIENIPELPGRTLVLVDTSASMTDTLSRRSSVQRVQAAALFGVAMGMRNAGRVDLYGFADGQFGHGIPRGGSVLPTVENFTRRIGEVGHGTRIALAMDATWHGHDRVVIFSDMQTFDYRTGQVSDYHGGWIRAGDSGPVSNAVPGHVPIYAWDLAGYEHTPLPAGLSNRHQIGGFSDAAFRIIGLLEAGRNADWPWKEDTTNGNTNQG